MTGNKRKSVCFFSGSGFTDGIIPLVLALIITPIVPVKLIPD